MYELSFKIKFCKVIYNMMPNITINSWLLFIKFCIHMISFVLMFQSYENNHKK
jgi:hypothetical protein